MKVYVKAVFYALGAIVLFRLAVMTYLKSDVINDMNKVMTYQECLFGNIMKANSFLLVQYAEEACRTIAFDESSLVDAKFSRCVLNYVLLASNDEDAVISYKSCKDKVHNEQ